MKSVGEAMAIGRTFKESLQKGLRSMENKRAGMGFDGRDLTDVDLRHLIERRPGVAEDVERHAAVGEGGQ